MVSFESDVRDLWILYFSDASYTPNFGVRLAQAHYTEDSDSIHIDSVSDVKSGTVGDYEVCWFTTEFRYINDDGSYGQYVVFYHAEIAVREGILEFEDRITTADGYADFDESDFSADLESWREVE